ncbi:protein-L-isoaspartate O-methyltransferase family protein [Croceibacterium aestuarii]|uniref:protein-L-isoaspartate O-methyltransferase family protein n=1 Tax=Croceibacterium aestuarii TaxID=3064139 RepID=UPI00272DD0D0|nr:protein-L-isoaspartate O-methyltransferase [Croceibacterium sp. D39]
MTVVEDRPMPAARKAMIDSQLRTSGVTADFVLRRMAAVAREDFVPAAARGVAYMDRAIALGAGRWLAAPIVQGMMLQEAAPTLADKVLLVDGGSGYLAALVGPLAGSLEVISPEEALKASRKKDFTLLMIDGAVEHLPEMLTKRLANDGRVVCGLVRNGLTRLAVGREAGGDVALRALAEVGIPALPEFAKAKAWSF